MKNKIKNFTKNKTAVGITCIGVAIGFSIINISFSGRSRSEDSVTVLVSNGEISAGDKITESMVSEIKLAGSVPSNIIKNKEEIVGKYAKTNLYSRRNNSK